MFLYTFSAPIHVNIYGVLRPPHWSNYFNAFHICCPKLYSICRPILLVSLLTNRIACLPACLPCHTRISRGGCCYCCYTRVSSHTHSVAVLARRHPWQSELSLPGGAREHWFQNTVQQWFSTITSELQCALITWGRRTNSSLGSLYSRSASCSL